MDNIKMPRIYRFNTSAPKSKRVWEDTIKNKTFMTMGTKNGGDLDKIKKADYFVGYNTKVSPNNPMVFENVYKRISKPIIISNLDEWNLFYNWGEHFTDDSECVPNDDEIISWFGVGGIDICWRIELVKRCKIKRRNEWVRNTICEIKPADSELYQDLMKILDL